MHHALQRIKTCFGHCGDFPGEARKRAFLLHIAHQHGPAGQQRIERFLPRFGADAVDDARALLLERSPDEPGDALLVRDAHHEEGLAGDVQEVAHVVTCPPGFFHATVKSTFSTRFSPFLMVPLMKWKSPMVSLRFTSMVTVSPG